MAAALKAVPATQGALASQHLRALIANRQILADKAIEPSQIQPASLDLRLGTMAWRVRTSFLPGTDATVMEQIEQLEGYPISLHGGAVLEPGSIYIVPLLEHLALPSDLAGFANAKSSTGRIDVLARLITDYGTSFDRVAAGYGGRLFLEIVPRTFSIVVRTGTKLAQLRLRRGDAGLTSDELRGLLERREATTDSDVEDFVSRDGMSAVRIDLKGVTTSVTPPVIAYRARRFAAQLDLAQINHYDPAEFWEPISANREGTLILQPGELYILASKNPVVIGPQVAAEMINIDVSLGLYASHAAGFFDPFFGYTTDPEHPVRSRAVLEVRGYEVPFRLVDNQQVAWLRYERLIEIPECGYGAEIGSNYQNQGLRLAKQFRQQS